MMVLNKEMFNHSL